MIFYNAYVRPRGKSLEQLCGEMDELSGEAYLHRARGSKENRGVDQ